MPAHLDLLTPPPAQQPVPPHLLHAVVSTLIEPREHRSGWSIQPPTEVDARTVRWRLSTLDPAHPQRLRERLADHHWQLHIGSDPPLAVHRLLGDTADHWQSATQLWSCAPAATTVTLQFVSPMFTGGKARSNPWPHPRALVRRFADAWAGVRAFAQPDGRPPHGETELAAELADRLEAATENEALDRMRVVDFRGQARPVEIADQRRRDGSRRARTYVGYVGHVTYDLTRLRQPHQECISKLVAVAEYTGTGAYTRWGMGATKVGWHTPH